MYYSMSFKAIRGCFPLINQKIGKLNDELKTGAEAWQRLWNARGGLREVFDDAQDEVASARSNPGKYLGSKPKDEDVNQFKKYCDVIKDSIEREENEHRRQEEGAKKTERNFRDLINKDKL